MKKVIELIRTCHACPAQWDAKLEDGRWAYFRYRHGYFTASIGDDVDSAVGGECVTEFELGDPLDGVMSDEVLMFELRLRGWEFDVLPSFSEDVFDGFRLGHNGPAGLPRVEKE